MSAPFTYGSVCSGIEAATVAWHPLGWRPAFFSEIEAFPRSVLAHHYPHVPCHGDFTTIGADEYGAIDLLVGGTPCQDFSVAGLRAGIDGERGNLTLEFLRLVARKKPRWIVWENVPGVLSALSHRAPDPSAPPDPVDVGLDGQEVATEDEYDSEELHALNCFLAGLSELGYGAAYRVYDAQYFGLAQRRERVFVVGYLGDWRRAAAVLFERESLRGDPPPSRESGARSARPIAGGAAGRGHRVDADTAENLYGQDAGDVAPTLRAGKHRHGNPNGGVMPAVAFADVADPVAANQARTYTREGAHNFRMNNVAHTASAVRRLTPRECERLQGFPDDYTLVTYRKKPAADGPRYAALGNSMPVTVMAWLGQRIQQIEELTKGERR